MKKIKIAGIVFCLLTMTFVAVINLSLLFDSDNAYELSFKDIEASAFDELPPYVDPGFELRATLCDDNETYIDKCVFTGNPDIGCRMYSDVKCPELTRCQLFGHVMTSETPCFSFCSRPGCDYSEPKVPCDYSDPNNPGIRIIFP